MWLTLADSEAGYLVEIGLHELKDYIDVLELPGAWRQHDVLDLHNICGFIAPL
jgi:hypothetical protein